MEQSLKKVVNIVKKPKKVFLGGYSGCFVDPYDNLWEVTYNPFMELDNQGVPKIMSE